MEIVIIMCWTIWSIRNDVIFKDIPASVQRCSEIFRNQKHLWLALMESQEKIFPCYWTMARAICVIVFIFFGPSLSLDSPSPVPLYSLLFPWLLFLVTFVVTSNKISVGAPWASPVSKKKRCETYSKSQIEENLQKYIIIRIVFFFSTMYLQTFCKIIPVLVCSKLLHLHSTGILGTWTWRVLWRPSWDNWRSWSAWTCRATAFQELYPQRSGTPSPWHSCKLSGNTSYVFLGYAIVLLCSTSNTHNTLRAWMFLFNTVVGRHLDHNRLTGPIPRELVGLPNLGIAWVLSTVHQYQLNLSCYRSCLDECVSTSIHMC
jgi:hypothetical protein